MHPEVPTADQLTDDDWAQLRAIYDGLQPFWEITQRLQGHSTNGSHGVIWEALPALDMLLTGVERQISALNQQESARLRRNTLSTNPLLICYQNAWEVLSEYNDLTDKSYGIYAAATLLNPSLRKGYFRRSWTGEARHQIEPMIDRNRSTWELEYRQITPESPPEIPRSQFEAFLVNMRDSSPEAQEDDFSRYISGKPTLIADWKNYNLFRWWMQSDYPQLRQWAIDTLSIPAMSTELERIFSQSKRMITADRNRVLAQTLEASQCMKHWLDQGLYSLPE
jgi:hypothetical protein